ncbi:MAG: hypothetical protein IPK35_05830 [Saprospiraceae bacterium]|jgi:hypothetical protein|nr:hypothetical protein [Saprospiraceae bacterium]
MLSKQGVVQTIVLIVIMMSARLCIGQYAATKDERVMTISEFVQQMQSTESEKIYLLNLKIVADSEKDSRYLLGAGNSHQRHNMDSLTQSYPVITVEKEIYVQNVYFTKRMILPKIIFKSKCHFEDIRVYGDLTFRTCIFDKELYCVKFESYYFDLIDCVFNEAPLFESVATEQTTISNCSLNDGIHCYQNDEPLNLYFYGNDVSGNCSFQSIREGGDMVLSSSTFNPKNANSNESVRIGGGFGSLDRLNIVNDTFSLPLNFSGSKISNNFIISNSLLHETNSFNNMSIPEGSTNIRWKYIKSFKLGVETKYGYFNGTHAITDTTEENYFDLIKVYSQLLRSYKNNGDQESYNACYIEMKDIQTQKARYNLNKSPSISSFFELGLNRFLKLFCDYGTNPVKAILMSTFVIFLFGILYFIFPSEGQRVQFRLIWKGIWSKRSRSLLKTQLVHGSKQFLNAFALSMNAFVTLGYGDMPARGVARYLAVLEGLTGWFLLSIFSSSLISQILQ